MPDKIFQLKAMQSFEACFITPWLRLNVASQGLVLLLFWGSCTGEGFGGLSELHFSLVAAMAAGTVFGPVAVVKQSYIRFICLADAVIESQCF